VNRRLSWPILCLAACLASACATLGLPRDALRVTLADVRLVETTLWEQVYRVDLRVQNRSDRTLVIRGGHVDLELNGRDFAAGVSDQPVTLEPFSEDRVGLRMTSTVFGFVRLFRDLDREAGPRLRYRLHGSFAVGGIGRVGFEHAGAFDPAAGAGEGPPAG
jgi:LEA14-like dessication related protein